MLVPGLTCGFRKWKNLDPFSFSLKEESQLFFLIFFLIFFSCLFRGESDSSRSLSFVDFFRLLSGWLFVGHYIIICLTLTCFMPYTSSEPGCIFSQSPPLTLYISNRSFISSTDLNASLFSLPRFRISSPFFPFFLFFFFFSLCCFSCSCSFCVRLYCVPFSK